MPLDAARCHSICGIGFWSRFHSHRGTGHGFLLAGMSAAKWRARHQLDCLPERLGCVLVPELRGLEIAVALVPSLAAHKTLVALVPSRAAHKTLVALVPSRAAHKILAATLADPQEAGHKIQLARVARLARHKTMIEVVRRRIHAATAPRGRRHSDYWRETHAFA